MTEIDSLYLMLLFELLLLLSVVCTVMVVVALLRRKKERRAIGRLVALVKEDSSRRQEETRSLLEKRFGFEADESEKIARTLSRKELGFYQTLINLFIKRDTKAMEELNIVFEDTVAPYRELDVSKLVSVQETPVAPDEGVAASPEPEAAEAEDEGELQRLRIENHQLLEELKLTMNTLGNMLGQYSTMFEGDTDVGAEAMAKVLEQDQEGTGPELQEESVAEGGSEAGEELTDTEGLIDDLEPNWDEALNEQLGEGASDEIVFEESEGDSEPNWDEALNEQLGGETADAEPSWEDALEEQQQDTAGKE